jgi:hypothetical protein
VVRAWSPETPGAAITLLPKASTRSLRDFPLVDRVANELLQHGHGASKLALYRRGEFVESSGTEESMERSEMSWRSYRAPQMLSGVDHLWGVRSVHVW